MTKAPIPRIAGNHCIPSNNIGKGHVIKNPLRLQHAVASPIGEDQRVPDENGGVETDFSHRGVNLQTNPQILQPRTGLENTGESVVVGGGSTATHISKHKKRFRIEPVGDVAPNHDVEQDNTFVRNLIEYMAGGGGTPASCIGPHEFNGERRVTVEIGSEESSVKLSELRQRRVLIQRGGQRFELCPPPHHKYPRNSGLARRQAVATSK